METCANFLREDIGTRFWPNCNFEWYLAVSEVNTDLASGHFQNDGLVQPSLDVEELFKYSDLRIKLGLNCWIMDDLIELLKYLFMSLVRKLQ